MELIAKLRKIDSLLQIFNREEYKKSVEEQNDFLNSFNEPIDDLERSFFQYRCQEFIRGKTKIFVDIGSYMLYGLIKLKYRTLSTFFLGKKSAIYLPDGKGVDIVPDSILSKYKDILFEEQKNYSLNDNDIEFLSIIEHRYKNKSFLLKIMVKIARYSYLIDVYKPKALIVCNEYSYTSSIMRLYCEYRNVKLINIMHGEKLYYIGDSFFHFDECYVWDGFYKDLFVSLRAENSQFVIEKPKCIRMEIPNVNIKYDYTFYCTDEDGKILKSIVGFLELLCEYGFQIAIRPHPRYSNVKKIKRICPKTIYVEESNSISLNESLGRTKAVISFNSTVLYQAYSVGKKVVIDDVTRGEEFKKLKAMKYIMFNKKYSLLSDELKSRGEANV